MRKNLKILYKNNIICENDYREKRKMNDSQFASKYITDKNLSMMIKQHINYVKEYLDKVETIENDIYKEISYKQLGTILTSTIEAICKLMLAEINNKCKKAKCKKECVYRKYSTNKKIQKLHIIDALEHLNNTRNFWISPEKMSVIIKLLEKRNYIHLSKYISDKNENIVFNKEFVLDLLEIYDDCIFQFDLNEWFFENEENCLKKLDENGFEFTQIDNLFYTIRFYERTMLPIFNKIVSDYQLSNDDNELIRQFNGESEEIRGKTIIELMHLVFNSRYSNKELDVKYQKLKNIINMKLLKISIKKS